jgi:hypothetical protein
MSSEARIRDNKHFAKLLRQRLEARHNSSTYIRVALSRLDDAQLIDLYLRHERTLLEHLTKLRASEVNHD